MAGLSPFFGTVYQIMQLQKLVNMFGGDRAWWLHFL